MKTEVLWDDKGDFGVAQTVTPIEVRDILQRCWHLSLKKKLLRDYRRKSVEGFSQIPDTFRSYQRRRTSSRNCGGE